MAMISLSVRTYSIFALATSSDELGGLLVRARGVVLRLLTGSLHLGRRLGVARRRGFGARLLDAAHVGRRRRLLRLGVRQAALAEGQVRGRALVVAARLLLLLQLAGDLLLLRLLRRERLVQALQARRRNLGRRAGLVLLLRELRADLVALLGELRHLAVRLVQVLGLHRLLHAHRRGGFVQQVDGFVRKAPPADVPRRELRRRDHRALVDLDRVVLLVLRRSPRSTETVCASSGSGTGTCWNRRSSAASCSMVFLNFSVVDAPMHLSKPRPERGLEDRRAVVPRGGRGAQVVYVVDEHHHRALLRRLDDLGDHDGEALLELAGHLAPRAHRAQVELEQPRVAQRARGRPRR
jgi:hypothetical protein